MLRHISLLRFMSLVLATMSWATASLAADCNSNGVDDVTDIASGTASDCNVNSVPDECDLAAATSFDCNTNGQPDECDFDDKPLIELPTPTSTELYGSGVALFGDRAVVGAPFGCDTSGFCPGAAYVFLENQNTWSLEQRLEPADVSSVEFFGDVIDMKGDWIAVGAPLDACSNGTWCGSVFLFRYNDSTWVEVQKITATTPTDNSQFASSVALEGNLLLVGEPYSDCGLGSDCGAVYAFEFDGQSWQETQVLTATSPAPDAQYGKSLATDGNQALIGSSTEAQLVNWSGVSWETGDTLTPAGLPQPSVYGSSVSIDGDLAVVGARIDGEGVGLVFQQTLGTWIRRSVLEAGVTGGFSPNIGATVVANKDSVAVADPLAFNHLFSEGVLTIYRARIDQWVVEKTILAPNLSGGFGRTLDLDASRLLIGASPNILACACSQPAHIQELMATDFNSTGTPDECEKDCNLNVIDDSVEIVAGSSPDCDTNGRPDECDGFANQDCNCDLIVDLGDYASFIDCHSGPSDSPPIKSLTGCDCLYAFDSDRDNDVDLADFSALQRLIP